MSGLPIPKSSIGALIPEMMLDTDDVKKLELIKIVNQRLLKMIKFDKSEGKFQIYYFLSTKEINF